MNAAAMRSRKPLTKRAAPNLLLPKRRARWCTGDLADAEPAPVRERGQEAVELAVDLDRLDDLAAVELEAAVEVVEPDARDRATVTALKSRDGSVLRDRVLAVHASIPRPGRARSRAPRPASAARPGRPGGRRRASATHSPRAQPEAGRERRRLAEVAPQNETPRTRGSRGGELRDRRVGAVARAVVDVERSPTAPPSRVERRDQLAMELGQALGLVERRESTDRESAAGRVRLTPQRGASPAVERRAPTPPRAARPCSIGVARREAEVGAGCATASARVRSGSPGRARLEVARSPSRPSACSRMRDRLEHLDLRAAADVVDALRARRASTRARWPRSRRR